ncbi:hypothetical protein MRX96_057486 [Rhipicephalus microplus]
MLVVAYSVGVCHLPTLLTGELMPSKDTFAGLVHRVVIALALGIPGPVLRHRRAHRIPAEGTAAGAKPYSGSCHRDRHIPDPRN